jgi:muramoyltetrapeptide carboxypeptidase LdcA involved in peptidoglycan recycling
MMLNQLKQQKGFDKLKGIILGKFENCKIIDKEDGTINDCINDFVKGLNIPVIADFDYGHISSRYVLPIGIDVSLEVSSKECLVKW